MTAIVVLTMQDDPAFARQALQEVHVAAHVVVEDRDVSARLVRDHDLVPVLDELPEHSAHGDDVVVGMR